MMEHEGEEESYRISLKDTIILFDTLEEKHLLTIGRLVHQKTGPLPNLFDRLESLRPPPIEGETDPARDRVGGK